MLKTYFKIAFRQLAKQKMYAAINIGGFAFSIAACLLIGLYINHELSYDTSYPDADRIYRVIGQYKDAGFQEKSVCFPSPMSKVLKSDFPEVEASARVMASSLFWGAGGNALKTVGSTINTHEDGFVYTDQSLFDILKAPLLYGSKGHMLDEPLTMVITKSKADKYFPGQDPIGKLFMLNDNKDKLYKVSGVIADFPATSHFSNYHFFMTLNGKEFFNGEATTWQASNHYNYLLLKPGTDVNALEKKMTGGILENYVIPAMKSAGDKNAESITQKASLHLQPIKDINLKSYDIHDSMAHGEIRFVWLFGAIAGFILVIACINFVNLSTARSANRAKEVGLRKVLGSERFGLVKQFLAESMLFSGVSFILGILLAVLLLPAFNNVAAKTLVMPWQQWWFVPLMILSAVLTGFLAGVYPAFYLSGFKPANVLKGKLSVGSKSPALRNGLVVFQFAISIILIIGTIVINSQMDFILNTKVGFEKDQIVMIQDANTLGTSVTSFKNELSKLSAVKSVSVSDFLPVAHTKRNGNTYYIDGHTKTDVGVPGQYWDVDADYLKTLGMKLSAGRNFDPEIKTDSQAVIINQTMAKKLNLKNPIGAIITNGWAKLPIIGVVEDFNYESLRDNIEPLVMHLGADAPSIVSIKVNAGDMKNTLAQIGATWKTFAPGQAFRYTYMDEQFAKMYSDVQRTSRIFSGFAVLAIVIACLGLFALAAFMAEQRSKEIGIRKVLGATVANITTLLSADFIKLVLLAIFIATPLAWWLMNKWLQDFTYRITISWHIFAFAGILSIVIAVITVSYQSVKAALTNPVKSIKAE